MSGFCSHVGFEVYKFRRWWKYAYELKFDDDIDRLGVIFSVKAITRAGLDIFCANRSGKQNQTKPEQRSFFYLFHDVWCFNAHRWRSCGLINRFE